LLSIVLLPILSLAESQPNIVLIFVDDMGYGDPGCYPGASLVETPNIDRLSEEGIRFTSGYVTAPVCGPCRVGLLSGAYQNRFGIQWNNDSQFVEFPSQQALLPEPLAAAGYSTAIFGKWNLRNEPAAERFDVARHIMIWEGDYFPRPDGTYRGVDNPKEVDSTKTFDIWGPDRPGDRYLTDLLTDDACEFIDENADRPFFLYLAYNAPHTPLQAKKSDLKNVAHIENGGLKLYASMVLSVDEGVGRVLGKLDEHGLAENTLVAFVSDNGPAYGQPGLKGWKAEWPTTLLGNPGPLNGRKGTYYEGGIRVPFILRWPDRLPAGKTDDRPVISMDLFPTFCSVAGTTVPDGSVTDGVDLLPFIAGDSPQQESPHNVLYWSRGTQGAIRKGDWKLVVNEESHELYNLDDDLGEKADLSSSKPELAKALLKDYRNWLSDH
jgi:arylsulfatase A-like enzyme